MTEQRHNDEMLLLDYLLGRCQEQEAQEVRGRLEADAEFRKLHDDIRNALAALRLSSEEEPPEDLADRTLSAIRSAKQTETLLARQELGRRAVWPTFSLRELAAMVAMVVLLAGIFIPFIRQSRHRENINECSSNVGQIGAALRTYANDHRLSLPVSSATGQRWLPSQDQPVVSNSSALFQLVRGGSSPLTFQCPAVGGGSFVVQAGMTDFPAGKYISYSYQHSLGPEALRLDNSPLGAVAETMAILADATPVFVNGEFRRDRVHTQVSDNHKRTGQNVLYLDMHVEWKENAAVGVNGNNIYLREGTYEYRGDETPRDIIDSFLLPTYSLGK